MSKAHTDKRYILLRETYHGKHSLARKLVDLRCCVLTQYARLLVSRMSENRLVLLFLKKPVLKELVNYILLEEMLFSSAHFLWTEEISAFSCVL